MDGFIQGLLGGIVPAILMVIVFFITLSGRLAKIETNICWLIEELKGCRLRSKDRSR
jgi:hypothetical protein